MMRIAFLGLGGVGGYFGAKVCRAAAQSANGATDDPVEVIFLAREKTAAVIRANGIKLITPEEEFVAHPHAVVMPGESFPEIDFLICSVKNYDLEESLTQFRNCISPRTVILPLQNGIDAGEKIKKLFPNNDVWSGCVYIVARITSPGVITETGNIHRLHFGGSDPVKTQSLFHILKKAHNDIFLHENIREVLWEKFVFISPIASITSYLDACIGKILEEEASSQLLGKLLGEICAVANAVNVTLPADIQAITLHKFRNLPYATTSSMHSDFQSGGKTELDSLTAHVVRLATQHAILVPTYSALLTALSARNTAK